MEFLDTLEAIKAETASVHTLFAGEGQRAPSRRGTTSPEYQRRLGEAVSFVADVVEGRRPSYHLMEALSTSDFPILFGDILDRQVLASYREWVPTWQPIAKRRVVRDFRGVKLFKPLTGMNGILEEVGELAEYPEGDLDEQATQTITVAKYGKRLGLSWESIVNDDLDQLRDIPNRMGRMARRTENRLATELYVDAAGPHASLYTVGNANIVNTTNAPGMVGGDDNPPLSVIGLTQALLVLGNMTDEDGNPIEHEAATLVVPPALEVTANNILNATAIELTTMGGTVDGTPFPERRLLAANWLSRKVRLVVNPIIPNIATSNGNTSWWVFADPAADREALVMAFLRGWEDPAVFMKSANARRVGGGDIDPLDGDFDTDSVAYKVRHVIGAARVDPKATVA
ncbi:MAG: hypothetical protein WCE98_09810, partial [Chlorobium sp.]